MKSYHILICFLFLFSCTNQSSSQLRDDELMKYNFTDAEIEVFQDVLTFFTNHICEESVDELSNIQAGTCFRNWMKKMTKAEQTGILDIGLTLEELKKIIPLSSNEYTSIWSIVEPIEIAPNIWSTGYLKYDLNGPIYKFLKILATEHQAVASYQEKKRSARISVSMIKYPLKNHEEFEVLDAPVRLMIAIHYITVYTNRLYSKIQAER